MLLHIHRYNTIAGNGQEATSQRMTPRAYHPGIYPPIKATPLKDQPKTPCAQNLYRAGPIIFHQRQFLSNCSTRNFEHEIVLEKGQRFSTNQRASSINVHQPGTSEYRTPYGVTCHQRVLNQSKRLIICMHQSDACYNGTKSPSIILRWTNQTTS